MIFSLDFPVKSLSRRSGDAIVFARRHSVWLQKTDVQNYTAGLRELRS
jgi:hypothetical protein